MRSTPFIRDEQGSSFVELSLILPVVIILFLGVVDFGLVYSQYMTVIDSTRAAAERATIYGQQINTSQVQTFATEFGAGVPGYAGSTSLVCTCKPGGTGVSCLSSCSGAVTNPLQYMQVTATASLPLIFGISGLPAKIPVRSVTAIRTPYTQGK